MRGRSRTRLDSKVPGELALSGNVDAADVVALDREDELQRLREEHVVLDDQDAELRPGAAGSRV